MRKTFELIPWKGRIGRFNFVLMLSGIIALIPLEIVLFWMLCFFTNKYFIIDSDMQHILGKLYFILYWIFLIFLSSIVIIKRLHDLDRPGKEIFIFLVPVYNLYLFYRLLLVKGTDGENHFGQDPTKEAAVNIQEEAQEKNKYVDQQYFQIYSFITIHSVDVLKILFILFFFYGIVSKFSVLGLISPYISERDKMIINNNFMLGNYSLIEAFIIGLVLIFKNKYLKRVMLILLTASSFIVIYQFAEFYQKYPPKIFEQKYIADLNGDRVYIPSFRGKNVFIYCWSEKDLNSKEELMTIRKLYNKTRDKDLKVYPIAYDTNIVNFLINNNIMNNNEGSLIFYLDACGEIKKQYNIKQTPTSVILNKNGNVVFRTETPTDWSDPNFIYSKL